MRHLHLPHLRGSRGGDRTDRQRGQVVVLFVLMGIVVIGSVAIVTDVSWMWYGQQRMQRAADAAALAGAIWLPGDTATAYSTARAEAAKNGFTNGAGGVVVTPLQDASNRRRLIVRISGPVGMFFARFLGTNSVQESVISKGEYVLPVPMGSPQNYYGVGDFVKTTTTSNTTNGQTGFVNPSQNQDPGNVWSNENLAYNWNNNQYATTGTGNGVLVLSQFGLQGAIPGGQTIDGIQVRIGGSVTSGNNCQMRVELSWNGGTNWSSQVVTPNLSTTNTVFPVFGVPGNNTVWGGHTWTQGDLSDANFRMRVTYLKAGCGTLNLDGAQVFVSYHQTTTTTTTGTAVINGPDGNPLSSQGFWGAVITKGGSRENGDQFSPVMDRLRGTPNPDHNPNGYDYDVVVKGTNGQLQLFDPTFCETGPNGSGGFMGSGDHWIGGPPNPVSTIFELWNTNNTPYAIGDDTFITSSGARFTGQRQADYSGAMGTPGHSGLTNCATDPDHNNWWLMASNLNAGTYRLNVTTTVSGNDSTNAENMWSAWVKSTGASRIYGEGRMVAYNNLLGGRQLFYLAQIEDVHAGKTMVITLFDPGDVSGNAFLRILNPDGSAYNYATFSYSADNGRTGTNVTQIQTASSTSGSFFNDAVLTITIPLPNTYGTGGLTPPGESEEGWWKIEYTVNGGNDTTTWQVAIRGNPVHLVP